MSTRAPVLVPVPVPRTPKRQARTGWVAENQSFSDTASMGEHSSLRWATSRRIGIAAAIITTAFAATAAPPVAAPAAPTLAFKRAELKIQPRATTSLPAADAAKVRALLVQRRADFGKDRDARKFLSGGSSLVGEAAVAYQVAAAALATGQQTKDSRFTSKNSSGRPTAMPPTYTIEAGAVTGATNVAPCDGTIDLSFTIKNRGAKPADGVVPNLFVDLSRATDWVGAHTTAWINVPSLPSGGTATVQISGLRHRRPNGSTCPSGEITVVPSFVGVVTGAEYRLKINLTANGAEATLLSGYFAALAPAGAGGSGTSTGGFTIEWPDGLKPPGHPGGDCGPLPRCSNGACALECPPCSSPYHECGGTCDIVPCP